MTSPATQTGDELARLLAVLASPQRLRILGALAGGRRHVSDLARDVGISRPLVHAHLARMAEVGLVTSHHELAEEGRAVRYVEAEPFRLVLTPELIAEAVRTLTVTDRRPRDTEEDGDA